MDTLGHKAVHLLVAYLQAMQQYNLATQQWMLQRAVRLQQEQQFEEIGRRTMLTTHHKLLDWYEPLLAPEHLTKGLGKGEESQVGPLTTVAPAKQLVNCLEC